MTHAEGEHDEGGESSLRRGALSKEDLEEIKKKEDDASETKSMWGDNWKMLCIVLGSLFLLILLAAGVRVLVGGWSPSAPNANEAGEQPTLEAQDKKIEDLERKHRQETEALKEELKRLADKVTPAPPPPAPSPPTPTGLKTAKVKSSVQTGAPPFRVEFWVEMDEEELKKIPGPVLVRWSFAEPGSPEYLLDISEKAAYVFQDVGCYEVKAVIIDGKREKVPSGTIIGSTGTIPTVPSGPAHLAPNARDRRESSSLCCNPNELVRVRTRETMEYPLSNEWTPWFKIDPRWRASGQPDIGYQIQFSNGKIYQARPGQLLQLKGLVPLEPDGSSLVRFRGRVPEGQRIIITVP